VKRLAAIDIGSNSIRSIIVEVPEEGPHRLLDDEKAYTRLGAGVHATGALSRESMDATVDALRHMLGIAEEFGVDELRAVATAAMRRASNAPEFLERLERELGLDVEIIPQVEEGRLAFLSAAGALDLEGRIAVMDIGGGSVEIVRATGHEVEFITSLPIGAVVMSERFHREDPMPKEDYKRLRKHVRSVLSHALGSDPDPVVTLVGSGGTVNALAAIVASSSNPSYSTLQGFELRREDLIHNLARLSRSDAEQRRQTPGLPENRVDIIVAGAVVVSEIMRALGANSVWVNTKGVREGIVIDTIDRMRGTERQLDRTEAIRAFGRRCGYDAAHAEQVCTISLSLFDQLAEGLGLDPNVRPLLEAAALLHDVGYHIAYERHHKHSYHLISYSDLPGFKNRELRLIAAIARYHRGALPKTRHEGMADLEKSDRKLVSRLGGILKLADGLDRTRTQRVDRVVARREGSIVTVVADGDNGLGVELHGARQKADLMERAFDVRVDVVHTGDREPPVA
jgi:exopolyphosphatase/guanosine-5'-triphosphate,3'-diphosphate pyrophosphatase